MDAEARVPSLNVMRQSMDDLRRGRLSPTDHEMREAVLQLASQRVEAALPDEVRSVLAGYPPQLIEAYGLLQRWQIESEQYPAPLEEASDQVQSQPSVFPVSSSSQRKFSQPVRNPMDYHYGPDRDLLINLSDDFVVNIPVPTGKRLNMEFKINGYHENGVIVYLQEGLQHEAERGNYYRSQEFWQSDLNLDSSPETYVVSGWNKESPPDAGGSWRQSPITVTYPDQFTACIFFHDLGPGSLGATVIATITE